MAQEIVPRHVADPDGTHDSRYYTEPEVDALIVTGGGGDVSSVNTQTGVVVLDADDIDDTATLQKFVSSADLTKLGGIAPGATANDTDANLKARANHTGTQSADTITDGTTNKAFLATERTKLTGVASGAEVNVNADWNAATGDAQILNKPATFTPSAHTHDDLYFTETEVTTALAGKSDTTHDHDLDYAPISHVHDDRYYTETETDLLLDGKSDTSHNHDADYADISHAHALDALSDVVITTPTSGQVVKYNGTEWVNGTDDTASGGTGATQLNDLTDVTITAAATGEFLRYNGTQWVDTVLVAGDIPSHSHTAANVSDFDVEVGNHPDVTANTTNRHSHANKALLDTYAQTEINLADAVSKRHAHANIAVLDATTASFLTADETKLTGIATAATANSSDATLLARANHTGTQSADTLTDGSTNVAFLATERTKLTGIAAGAQVNTVDSVASKTGAVTLVKADVGLGSVDNTSDAAKPVSTAQQTALNLKSDTTHGHTITVGIPLVLDGGGAVLTTGVKLSGIEIPFAATITGWTVTADVSGSIVCTVSKATYANVPTFTAISGTEKPTLSSAQKNQDLSLTTWTTAVAAGDLLEVSIDSVATITRATLNIRMTRTV